MPFARAQLALRVCRMKWSENFAIPLSSPTLPLQVGEHGFGIFHFFASGSSTQFVHVFLCLRTRETAIVDTEGALHLYSVEKRLLPGRNLHLDFERDLS